MVGRNGRQLHGVDGNIDEDNGKTIAHQPVKGREVFDVATVDDRAARQAGVHRGNDAIEDVLFSQMQGHHEVVVTIRRSQSSLLDQIAIDGISKIRRDKPKKLGFFGPKHPGGEVGTVSEPLRGLLDDFFGIRVDSDVVAEGSRDR